MGMLICLITAAIIRRRFGMFWAVFMVSCSAVNGNEMIGNTISHYKIIEKLGEARLLMTCIGDIYEVQNG